MSSLNGNPNNLFSGNIRGIGDPSNPRSPYEDPRFLSSAEQQFEQNSPEIEEQRRRVEREELRLIEGRNPAGGVNASRGTKFTMTNTDGSYRTYRTGEVVFYNNKSYVAIKTISGSFIGSFKEVVKINDPF